MDAILATLDNVGIVLTVALFTTNALSFTVGSLFRRVGTRGGVRYMRLLLSCLVRPQMRVRFSSSALLSLTHNDHFLMIQSTTGDDLYWAPVGGVLKRHPSSSQLLQSMGVLPDVAMRPSDDRDGDIRLLVPGRRFRNFLEWYEACSGRETVETALLREMYEELTEFGLRVEHWFRELRLPLSRQYSAPPAIFRDSRDSTLWHYRLFVTIELEEPARSHLLQAVENKVKRDPASMQTIAFISHRDIAARRYGQHAVGFHSDALLCRPIDPSGLIMNPAGSREMQKDQSVSGQ